METGTGTRNFLIVWTSKLADGDIVHSLSGKRLRVTRQLTRSEFVSLAHADTHAFGPVALTNRTDPDATYYYDAVKMEEE